MRAMWKLMIGISMVALVGCGTRDGTTSSGTTDDGGTTGGDTAGTTGGDTAGTTGGDTAGTTSGDTAGTTGGDTAGTTGGDTAGTTGGGAGTDTTIEALQTHGKSSNCNPSGIENVLDGLVIRGAIVTGGQFVAHKETMLDGYTISSAAGGPNNGIQLTIAQELNIKLAVGETVDVWGEYMEFYCNSQFRATKVEKTGTADVPAAAVVEGSVMAAPETAEPYEGVLVQLNNVEVTEVTQFDYTVTGGAKVGHKYSPGYNAQVGDKFTSITGVVLFAFENYVIHPRDGSDLAGLTEGEAVPSTIEDLQKHTSSAACENESGNLPPAQFNLEITGIVVSPLEDVSANLNGFYISTATAGEWSGVQVVFGKDQGVTVVIGDEVKVVGDVKEYFCLTEIVASSVEVLGQKPAPEPIVLTPADLTPAKGEPYEGTLVTLEGLTIANLDNFGEYSEVVVDDGFILALHDYSVKFTPTVGQKITSVTGAIKWSFGAYKLVVFGAEYITTE